MLGRTGMEMVRCSGRTRAIQLKAAAKKLAVLPLEFASFEQLGRESKVAVDAHDEQLLEVTLALHGDAVA